jgi:hypothetical protein
VLTLTLPRHQPRATKLQRSVSDNLHTFPDVFNNTAAEPTEPVSALPTLAMRKESLLNGIFLARLFAACQGKQ